LLLFGSGGDFGDGRADLNARLVHVANESLYLVGHAIEPFCQNAEFIAPVDSHSTRKVTLADHIHYRH
jgi:hypothetical protein